MSVVTPPPTFCTLNVYSNDKENTPAINFLSNIQPGAVLDQLVCFKNTSFEFRFYQLMGNQNTINLQKICPGYSCSGVIIIPNAPNNTSIAEVLNGTGSLILKQYLTLEKKEVTLSNPNCFHLFIPTGITGIKSFKKAYIVRNDTGHQQSNTHTNQTQSLNTNHLNFTSLPHFEIPKLIPLSNNNLSFQNNNNFPLNNNINTISQVTVNNNNSITINNINNNSNNNYTVYKRPLSEISTDPQSDSAYHKSSEYSKKQRLNPPNFTSGSSLTQKTIYNPSNLS